MYCIGAIIKDLISTYGGGGGWAQTFTVVFGEV